MRLNEREAIIRRNRGVVTMEDVERDRKARESQERRREERQRRDAKAATRGLPLLEVADVE
jgi:hypothetical protein